MPREWDRHGSHKAARHPAIAEHTAAVASHPAALDDLAAEVLEVFVATPGIGTLHLVTGIDAVQQLVRHLDADDARRLVGRAVQSIATMSVALGAPEPATPDISDRLRADHPQDWAEVIVGAAQTTDVHVIKLVFSAHRRYRQTGDDRYRAVAARQVFGRRRSMANAAQVSGSARVLRRP